MESKKNAIIDIDDIKELWKIFQNNWYYFVILPILAFCISYIYTTYKLPNIYGASTQILLKSSDVYGYQDQMYRSLGVYASYENTSNQIRIVKSSDLIRIALMELNMNVSYYNIGRIKTEEMYGYVPFEVVVNNVSSEYYEQEIGLKIKDEHSFELTYTHNNEVKSKIYKFNEPIVEDQLYIIVNNIAINKQRATILQDANFIFKIHNWDNLVNIYKSKLNVTNLEYTAILSLEITDSEPKRAIQFLDTLSKIYINHTTQSEIEINERTIEYIDKQLNVVIDKLQGIEDELEGYRENTSILDLSREEEEYFAEYLKYETKKRDLNLQQKTIESLENYIINSEDEKLLPPSLYILENDEYLKTTLNELYSLQMVKSDVLFKETESSMNISEANKKIEELRKNILTYLLNTKKALNDQIAAVQGHIAEYESIIKKIPGKERQMLQIQRRIQVNEKMYLYLLEKRTNTVIARAGIVPQTKIIEKTRSTGIVSPNKNKIHITFISISLIIVIIITFIRSTIFYKIKNIDELRKYTKLPIIGEIIKIDNIDPNYAFSLENPKSAITETFRTIRTNLAYFTSNLQSKTILITSNNPGEGKTFCSINLASIIAKAGKKVLLLEADLHKPKIGKGLNLTSDVGLSTILIGKATMEDVIIKSSIEHLDVILSGPTPPNASELILSDNFENILKEIKQKYEFIIIDSPPTGLITDALVMQKFVNVTLFVIHAQYATKDYVNIPNEIVETHELSNFAIIMNGSKLKKSKYYYKGYGYYGYGYGYGNNSQKQA